jgi:hypothetical protein
MTYINIHYVIWTRTVFKKFNLQLHRPPLWSSGQCPWLQIHRSGLDSWRYEIVWEVVGLERGSLSLVSTTEEPLGKKSSGSGLRNRDCGRRDPPHWPRNTPLSANVGGLKPRSYYYYCSYIIVTLCSELWNR